MKKPKNVRFLSNGEQLCESVSTGISLHCHTQHSKEILDFVPYYAERIPLISKLWRREQARWIEKYGRPPEFSSGYWTPPLTGRQVFDSEASSLQPLGLKAIVAITDHDSIQANLDLREEIESGNAPISMEWTVPFGGAFFHIGVHNLPPGSANDMKELLLEYTFAEGPPDDIRLNELFGMLCDIPSVLIVLNHPVWDIEMIGQQLHEEALEEFLRVHQRWLHAIEINGFRAWRENETAIQLAERLGLPIVSGGDRHCMHSNTMVNISNAATFTEFVDEVRVGGHSRIIVKPEYRTPLPARQVASIAQILGNYSDFPEGRRKWSDRVYFDANDGSGLMTLTEQWEGRQPFWARVSMVSLQILAHPLMQRIIALSVADADIGRDDSIPLPVQAIHNGHVVQNASLANQ